MCLICDAYNMHVNTFKMFVNVDLEQAMTF